MHCLTKGGLQKLTHGDLDPTHYTLPAYRERAVQALQHNRKSPCLKQK